MTRIFSFVAVIAILFNSCTSKEYKLKDGLYAEIETSKGNILLNLEFEKTPVTVANFVSLSEGKNPYVAQPYKGKPFYNGLKFHRVIADFMIQGGCPDGNGSGGPGFKFKDEFLPELKMDRPGVLAMANSGPETNGSQFFITHKETNYLNGRHSVFGNVIEGQKVVDSIKQDDKIVSISIIRKGIKAKKFDAAKVFKDYFDNKEKEEAEKIAKFTPIIQNKKSFLDKNKKSANKTASGLQFIILKKGSGEKPKNGTQIKINYAGYFEDGKLFDSNIETVAQQFGTFDPNRKAQNGYAPMPFTMGTKEGIIPGFIEAVEMMTFGEKSIFYIPSNIGYGSQPYGIIPANSNLVFELEIIK